MEFYYTDTSFLRSYRYVTQEAVLHVYRRGTSVARVSSLDQCCTFIVIGPVLHVYCHWTSVARVSSLDQCCTCIVIGPVLSVYHHWTSVARLSSLDQCFTCIVIGPVLHVYLHWTIVARVSSLYQCCTCIVIGPVLHVYRHWTSVECVSSLDQCCTFIVIGPVLHVYRHWTSVERVSSLDQCWACIVIGPVLHVYRHWTSDARVSSLDQPGSLSATRLESGTKSVFPKRSPGFQRAFLFTCFTYNYEVTGVFVFDFLRYLAVTFISKTKASRQPLCHICELCSTRHRSMVSCCANFLSVSTDKSKECGRAIRSWTVLTCLEYPLHNQAIKCIHSRQHNLCPSPLGY